MAIRYIVIVSVNRLASIYSSPLPIMLKGEYAQQSLLYHMCRLRILPIHVTVWTHNPTFYIFNQTQGEPISQYQSNLELFHRFTRSAVGQAVARQDPVTAFFRALLDRVKGAAPLFLPIIGPIRGDYLCLLSFIVCLFSPFLYWRTLSLLCTRSRT